jgi:hypothetical protein
MVIGNDQIEGSGRAYVLEVISLNLIPYSMPFREEFGIVPERDGT